MVIEDSSVYRLMLKGLLTREGYEVILAENGSVALEMLKTVVPDIFLLDIEMPGLSGIEVCDQIKSKEDICDIPVIFLTGNTREADIEKGFDVGASDYIPKPYKKRELLARLKTHLRLHESLRTIQMLHQQALDSNPLTRLPGNNSINDRIQSSIETKGAWTVVYLDIDNFKAFNDKYSFTDGDKVILFTAECCKKVLGPRIPETAFLGHIGGDDFVMVLRSSETEQLMNELIKQYDSGAPSFYNETDREQGYIESVDRKGVPARYPFVSISLAGVKLRPGNFEHHLQVANVCAEVKKRCKNMVGSIYYENRRLVNH